MAIPMIGIDTNILVRYLTRDDEPQFEMARRLIHDGIAAGQPMLVSLLVLLETEWVLRSCYQLARTDIAAVFTSLLETRETAFEDEQTLEEALHSWKNCHADFADCLIVAKGRRLGCASVATFDLKAGKLRGAELLEAPSSGYQPNMQNARND